jgi:hypothetical protein
LYRITAQMPAFRHGATIRPLARRLPSARLFMGYQSRSLLLVLVVMTSIAAAIDARASDTNLPFPHVRATDPELQALIDDATETSATVRRLLEQIAASDLIVFVGCEPDLSVRVSGRLNFMASAGGFRYVVIHLKPKRRTAAIAMLAHELRHAAEIAAAPSIVDEASLTREYERIGYRSRSTNGGLAFETQAAVETGRRVVEELAATKTAAAD